MRLGNLLLGLVLVAAAFGAPSRVLFVGDSFTFVQDLPHRFAAVAQSKGHQVEIANSTIGGCTLYYIYNTTETQDLLKQQWDYIVLQDFSQLPTVPEARRRMQDVAIRAFAAKKGNAKLVSYNTWGYFEGINKPCPDSDNAQCFPLGTLAQLSPNCQNDPNVWQNKVRTYDCMTYAVARGYIDTFSQGIHLVVPCGESWQVARDSTSIPADCKALIDKEYSAPLANLTLPLQVPNKGDTAHIMLYNDNGKDKHPSPAGQYLNSLVFYATLFNDSPVGATYMEIPAADAAALQRVAAGVVLNHKQAWGLN